MKIGDRVTYQYGPKLEHGVIKSIPDTDHCFVVYNCDDNWDEYENFTANLTRTKDLIAGWK